jgi:hypothetical protein
VRVINGLPKRIPEVAAKIVPVLGNGFPAFRLINAGVHWSIADVESLFASIHQSSLDHGLSTTFERLIVRDVRKAQ